MADAPPDTLTPPAEQPHWPGWLIATAICIRFYSRLPVPLLRGEDSAHGLPDFRLVPRAVPLAALVIALPAALVLLAAGATGVSPALAATLAITAAVLTTGAFHEDGLADTADGLFGGHTPERRLEIMKGSRVGTFGALALGLSLLLRVTALAAILQALGPLAAAAAMLIAAPWSRATALYLLATEPPARSSGASAAFGQPTAATAWTALALALAFALAGTLTAGLPSTGLALGMLLSVLAVAGLARLARQLIGGQTGDILGAAQQLAEIALTCGFAFALGTAVS